MGDVYMNDMLEGERIEQLLAMVRPSQLDTIFEQVCPDHGKGGGDALTSAYSSGSTHPDILFFLGMRPGDPLSLPSGSLGLSVFAALVSSSPRVCRPVSSFATTTRSPGIVVKASHLSARCSSRSPASTVFCSFSLYPRSSLSAYFVFHWRMSSLRIPSRPRSTPGYSLPHESLRPPLAARSRGRLRV